MLRNTKIAIVTIALVVTSYAAFAAKAKNSESDVVAAIKDTRISLSQAVAAAETRVGGKAVSAEYEKTKKGWAYDIEIVKADKMFDVLVDSNYGNVISSAEDVADQDDEKDETD